MSNSSAKVATWSAAFSVASVWFGTDVGGGQVTRLSSIMFSTAGWLRSFP